MTQLCNKLLFMCAQDKTNTLSGAQGLYSLQNWCPIFFFQYSKTIIQHGHFLGRCSSACWDLTWGPVRVWAGGWRGASSPPGWQGALVQHTEPLTARGTGLQGSRLTLKSLHILKCKGKRPVYMCLTCVSVKKLNSPKINTLSCCFISVKQVKILFFHQSSASGSRLKSPLCDCFGYSDWQNGNNVASCKKKNPKNEQQLPVGAFTN